MRTRSLVAATFVALIVTGAAVPAAAGGGGGGLCGSVSEGGTVAIRDFCFEGTAHLAETGQTVHMVNEGETVHDVTASDGSFASGPLQPGDSFDVSLGSRRVVRYYCSLHGSPDAGGMAGVIVSNGGEASASAATVATDGAAPAGEAAPTQEPAAPTAIDSALVAATNAAQSDATVALVVVTVIGMAVAFGLGLVVWAVGRLPSERRGAA